MSTSDKRRSTVSGEAKGPRGSRASFADSTRRSTVKRPTLISPDRPSVTIPNVVPDTVIAEAESGPPPQSPEAKQAQVKKQQAAVGNAKKYLADNETIE